MFLPIKKPTKIFVFFSCLIAAIGTLAEAYTPESEDLQRDEVHQKAPRFYVGEVLVLDHNWDIKRYYGKKFYDANNRVTKMILSKNETDYNAGIIDRVIYRN